MTLYQIDVVIETNTPVDNPVQPERPHSHFDQRFFVSAAGITDAIRLIEAEIADGQAIRCSLSRVGVDMLRPEIADALRARPNGLAWKSDRAPR